MRFSTIVIVALWGLAIWGAITGSSRVPAAGFPKDVSPILLASMLAMPVLFFGFGAFWMRRSPFYSPFLAKVIDARFGENALASFLARLKPMLLFALCASTQGVVGLWRTYSGAHPTSGAYAVNGFFLSGGVAFALAHFILYLRKVPGVYPSDRESAARVQIPAPPERKSLRDALRLYWWCLVGLAVFPTAVMLGEKLLHLPFEVFILPFFAVGLLAGWPHFSGRAPYTFWLVACLVWLLGGVVGIALTQLVRYPLWAAVAAAYLLFLFLNGSLAYRSVSRRLTIEGKKPPPYLQYIFLPTGIPKFKEEAPRSTHVFVGVAALVTGAFFVFCGVALAFDAEWSRIAHPFVPAAICLFLAGIGAAFLYVAWRLFAFRRLPSDAA